MAGSTSHGGVSIRRVMSRAAAAVKDAPVTMLGIAFLFGALPGALFGFVFAGGDAPLSPTLADMAFWTIAQGALIRATAAHARGRRAGWGERAAVGLRAVLPLLGMLLVAGFAVLLGLTLLVVPGVVLVVVWSVAAPVLVEERRGIVGSLGRSRALTRGARWNVFALLAVVFVVWSLLSSVVGVLGVVAGGGLVYAARDGVVALPFLALGAVVQALTAVVWGTIQTSLYLELRDRQDGPETDALAEIFA